MRTLCKITAIAASWLFCVAAPVRADFASAPFTGAAIVTNAKFTNVYLFKPDSLGQTWDQHLAKLGRTETRGTIDGFVGKLVSTTYFFPLTQYGIFPPVFLGSANTVEACVGPALRDRVNGVIQWNTLRSFASCEHDKGGRPSDQVNIFVSPDLNVAGPNFGPDSSPAICASGSNVNAYHAWGLGVPNFSVIPLHPKCNPNLQAVMRETSHEMVEIVSDPAGFGFLHETGPFGRIWPGDFIPDLSSGELGDICEPGGPSNPGKDQNIAFFTDSGMSLSRYWSNIDNDCQPKFLMNRTWLSKSGTPLIRFTGGVHTLSFPVTVPGPDAPLLVRQLMILTTTGGDDLRGGNGPRDNASIVVGLHGGRTITIHNINWGHSYGNGEFHAANLELPQGIRGRDLASIAVHTNFSGGCCGDNWNLSKLKLMAKATPGSPPPPNTFNAVEITVATGHDDARSDTEISAAMPGERGFCLKPSNNADPNAICNNNGRSADQNGHQAWNNWTTSTQDFNLSNPQTLPAFSTIGIHLVTHNNGTEGDDNWDLQGLRVRAVPTDLSKQPVTLLSLGHFDNKDRGSNSCIRRVFGPSRTVTFKLKGGNTVGPCND